MREIQGRVGPWSITWKTVPRGPSGMARAEIEGIGQVEVRWRQDVDGIWLELPNGVFGFDLDAEVDEDGRLSYWVMQRSSDQEWANQAFIRFSEQAAGASTAGKKKGVRVRAQMPGKIVRIVVSEGAVVEKNQSLGMMEAMKMENEIRAPQAGRVSRIAVAPGQAVETGADLFMLEPV